MDCPAPNNQRAVLINNREGGGLLGWPPAGVGTIVTKLLTRARAGRGARPAGTVGHHACIDISEDWMAGAGNTTPLFRLKIYNHRRSSSFFLLHITMETTSKPLLVPYHLNPLYIFLKI